MAEDFSGQDCRGQSFKNQDLTAADFSDSDVRGVDFSGADLTAAIFCRAKMGRTWKMTIAVLGLQLLLSVIVVLLSLIGITVNSLLYAEILKSFAIYPYSYLIAIFTYSMLYASVAVLAVNRKRLDYMLWFVVITAVAGAGAEEGAVAVGAFIPILLGVYLGWRANKKEEPQLLWLRALSLKIACLGGTQFAFANLKDVDFSGADLKYARFNQAKIINCKFQHAQNHHLALTKTTPLGPRKVRDLVIDRIITDKNFSNLDLSGLNFSGLDLRGLNFTGSNVSFADFSASQSQEANLREINAVGACFNQAHLTGACLQNWNIDTRTLLHDIDCDYVYLAENKQQRNPPEGNFKPGEFSKLYQQIADTIDFIAHSRTELDTLISAIATVKAEKGHSDIFVQNIERKDSSIVVKVKAPPEFDREQIYKEVKKEQKQKLKQLKNEYEQKLLAKQSELDNEKKATKDLLADLLKDSLKRPFNVEQNLMKDNSRNFSGNDNKDINLGDKNISNTITDSIVNGSIVTAETVENSFNSIQNLPPEHNELKTLLSQLQDLINKSTLPDQDKQEALTEAKTIAEATTKPKE